MSSRDWIETAVSRDRPAGGRPWLATSGGGQLLAPVLTRLSAARVAQTCRLVEGHSIWVPIPSDLSLSQDACLPTADAAAWDFDWALRRALPHFRWLRSLFLPTRTP